MKYYRDKRPEYISLKQELILPNNRFFTAVSTVDGEVFDFLGFEARITTESGKTTIRWFDQNIYYTVLQYLLTETR